MKNKITIKKDEMENRLTFVLHADGFGPQAIHTTDCTGGVFHYFCHGVSESKLYNYNKWGRNPKLDKVIRLLQDECRSAAKPAGRSRKRISSSLPCMMSQWAVY